MLGNSEPDCEKPLVYRIKCVSCRCRDNTRTTAINFQAGSINLASAERRASGRDFGPHKIGRPLPDPRPTLTANFGAARRTL